MPRSSRHRSHRSRKHSRDRSDSEEESSRERRAREEETSATSGGRVSRDSEPEKRRSLHEHAGKEAAVTINGDSSGERKRKTIEEVVVVADRWNGGKENDDKRSKGEESGPVDLDKPSKSKAVTDSKGRLSRRYEGSNERDEDRGGKNDSTKGKSWKESSRRESSHQYKDGKERDSDKDREDHDSRHDKSDELHSRKHSSRTVSGAEEITPKKYTKTNEKQAQDVLPSAETDKGPEKHTRRRDDSEDKDKWFEDNRDSDDRRVSSRDHSRSRSYKDERHDNVKFKGKYRVDDRDQNHRDDKYQDEWSSKDRASDKSDRGLRDENKPQESHYRKAKLQDTDHNGISYVDNHDSKLKDGRGRKRYSDEKDDHGDLKLRGLKDRHEVEKNALGTSRTSSHNDKSRSGYLHTEKADSSPKHIRFKSSTSSGAYAGNDHNRDFYKIEESVDRVSAPEERSRSTAVTKGEYITETAPSSKYDRTPRSDARTSPSSGRRFSERSPSKYDRTARRNLDSEVGQRRGSSKDGDTGDLGSEKQLTDDISQTDACARESTPIGSSSINQRSNMSDRSPSCLRPPPPVRLGVEGPSVLGPYQDDNKGQGGDYRSYRYKRVGGGDHGYGRGPVNSWKGAPNWSSPVANNFIPLQHGPPPAGFHPAMSQFSAPPLFGVRPSMDLAHGGVSYHMHDMAERFAAHGRPFGWHNPVDQLCHPQMQMWDGSNGMFNNESHMYGRQEWDENGQLISSRGWEMSSEMWKEQNNTMDIPASKKEQDSPADEQVQPKRLPTENIETKQSSDSPASKIDDAESSQKAATRKSLEPSSMQDAKLVNYVAHYLTRVDISPDLAGLELYKECMSQLDSVVANDAWNLTATCGCFRMNKDSNTVEMKSSSSILKSFFPAAKDVVFKKAISLYQKQSGRANGKHACSEELKHDSPPEATENKMLAVPENENNIMEPEGPCGVCDPSNNNNTDGEKDSEVEVELEAEMKDDEKPDVVAQCSDGGPEGSEPSTGEEISGARLTWIPNSDENTH